MSIYDSLTRDWLTSTFLLGVDLTLDDGTPFPDVVFEQAIRGAVSHLEHEIGITIDPYSITNETHDAELKNQNSYWPFRLDLRPVLSFQAARIRLGSFAPVTMPVSWLRSVSSKHGQIHIIPSQESLSSYFFTTGVPLLGGYGLFTTRDFIPGYFEFDYTAGFETREGTIVLPNGENEVTVDLSPKVLAKYDVTLTTADAHGASTARVVSLTDSSFKIQVATAPSTGDVTYTWSLDTLPKDLRHAIGIKAATNMLLSIAGDLILGAGIASQTLQIDGLQQTIGSTASAMYGGYSARLESFEKQYKMLLHALKAEYKVMKFGVV